MCNKTACQKKDLSVCVQSLINLHQFSPPMERMMSGHAYLGTNSQQPIDKGFTEKTLMYANDFKYQQRDIYRSTSRIFIRTKSLNDSITSCNRILKNSSS